MKNTEIFFESPYFLLLMIPAVCLIVAAYRFMRADEEARRAERPAMLLKAAEAVLLTLMIAGLSVVTHSRAMTTVILADRSDSMLAVADQVDALVKEASEGAEAEETVRVVDFAQTAVWDRASLPAGGATDIAAAIELACSAVTEGAGTRLLLISDGHDTDGDLSAAVQTARELGVRLDTLPITPPTQPDMELTTFSLPADAAQGQRFSADVAVVSREAGRCALRILDGEALVYEAELPLEAGENAHSFELTAGEVGQHTYRAEIASDTDAVPQNNIRYACMDVSSGTRILLVDGTGGETAKLAQLIESSGNDAAVVQSADMPQTLAALCEYGMIVLMNVDVKDLPEGSAQRLEEYVRDYGRSVLTTGGENTYIYGNMKDTAFESFLPVKMGVEEKESVNPVALMLVIDTTDSMTRQSGGVPIIEMARRGAIKCVDGLNSNDYVGVITFSDEAEVLVEMTASSEKDGVISAIAGIGTASPDNQTKFAGALQLACDELKKFDKLERKHVIFITDGSPADARTGGFEAIVKNMRGSGITMSSIVVGRLVNVVKLLEGLSVTGGGRCYLVEGADDLPDVMSTDTVLSQVEYTIDSPIVPQLQGHLLPDYGEGELEQLYGYIRTSAKGGASVALSTEEGRPIYAQWNYGTGKAASFMSDLNGDWSRLWFTDERGRAMIAAMIAGLSPETIEQTAVDVRLLAGGARGLLSVGGTQETKTVQAQIVSPTGAAQTVVLKRAQDGRFEAEIELDAAGRYAVDLTWLDSQGNVLDARSTSVTHAYSGEYAWAAAKDGGLSLMEAASETGGAVVHSVEAWRAIGWPDTLIERDAMLPLAVAVMVCLLADIVIRRTKLKRIKGFLSKKRT